MKAVLYGRYSSHSQKDASIEQQFRECREFAERNDIQIIGEYADHALTGKTDKRPEFQRMIRDSARGRFQYVITWKVDRFARNRYDAATYKARLKKHGVKVLYAKESIPDGPEGILLESVLEGSAEYYSANLSQNIKRGMLDNARECKSNGSRVIGYRVGPDQRFEIDPETAPIVRRIFEQYDAGTTQKVIVEDLNAKGFKTLRGKPFNKNSLTRILKNEKYIGIYEYADVRIEGGIPQIIEKELFDSVQSKLNRNKRAPAHRWDIADYLLTGKLFCGHCGAAMVGRAGTGKSGRKYNYYACVGRTRRKACDKKPVAKDRIEELVVRITVDQVLLDSVIEQIATAAVALQEQERDQSVLRGMEAKLRETEKAITNIIAAIEQGIITPSTKSRLMELEDDKASLEAEIENEKLEKPMISKEQLVTAMKAMRSGDVTSEKFQSRIIDTFISAIYLYDDRLVITYNFSGENNKVSLENVNSKLENLNELNDLECSPLDSSAPPNEIKPCQEAGLILYEGAGAKIV